MGTGAGRPGAPLTVWLGAAMYTFAPGHEITVGRADTADIRVASEHKQAISRTHMVIRHEGTGWVAHDQSRNGIYVGTTKVPSVEITDDTAINLGAPEGPRLTFRITSQAVPAASRQVTPPPPTRQPAPPRTHRPAPPPRTPHAQNRPPQAPTRPPQVTGRPPAPPRAAHPPPPPRQAAPPPPPSAPQSGSFRAPQAPPTPTARPPAAPPASSQEDADLVGRMTGAVKRVLPSRPAVTVPPGGITLGRAATNSIVVEDPLVSRVHAILAPGPGGMTIRDNASSNGTFINGVRLTTTAVLRPGDTVTVGNVDLSFDGSTLSRRTPSADTSGLGAHNLGFTIDGHQLLSDVTFTARPGTVTAVIGPSGAGKSTLIKLLGGQNSPSSGGVTFDGHNVHAEYASMRSRIGMVPQDDVVHRQLTVEQALRYAAELRLPPDTSRADRRALIDRVLEELELTEHRQKRVDKLSGGQRKRASVAMELLTGPSLLILDEPTSGLDPALDRQVMSMLRRLADAGRVVIVVTHSLTYLNMCDQVLLLAPGGKTAYAGPPREVAATMGTADWADIFAWVSSDPDGAHRAYLARNPSPPRAPAPAPAVGPAGTPTRTSTPRQVWTVARRQLRLIAADRGYFAFLLVLPFLLGALSLVVPGDVGLGMASRDSEHPSEPTQLLILLNIAVVFMGTALTIRDLVGERNVFRREQSVGLSAAAYLVAKIGVYSVAAAAQAAVLTAIVIYGKGAPEAPPLLFGNAGFELYVTLAAAAIVSAMVGLALSSIARTGEQILPMLVAVVFLSIVFAGGMIPITGRVVLEQVSWFIPARWAFAASASVIDLLQASPLLNIDDPLWRHGLGWWLLDMGILLGWGAVAIGIVAWRIRLTGRDTGPGRRWLAVTVIVIVAAVFVAALSYLTRDGGTRDVTAGAPFGDQPTQGPAPEQDPIPPGELTGLLLDAEAVGAAMDAPQLASATPENRSEPAAYVATPPECIAAVAPGAEGAYRETPFTGMAGRTVTDPGDPRTALSQYVVSFPDAGAAARYQDAQINRWRDCAETAVTVHAPNQPPQNWDVGAVDTVGGRLSVVLTRGDTFCQRALATDSNVVIDVRSCGPTRGQHAETVATRISDKIS